MGMERFDFDHNATTPIRPEVSEAISDCWHAGYANPSSQHEPGRRAAQRLEESRRRITELLGGRLEGADPDRLIFTSGGTEANNLALFGLSRAQAGNRPASLLISAVEHPSVLRPAEHLLDLGWRLDTLGVTSEGIVRVEHLERFLRDDTALVSVVLANHETGVIQPVAELAEICRQHHVPLHTDAVQAAGKIPVDFQALGADALSVAAHKFHGPLGIGALLLRGGARIVPMLYGGEQQQGIRPGTENVPLAVGMQRALELASEEMEQQRRQQTNLRERFEARLRTAIPGIVVHGAGAPRIPQTSNVAFPGVDAQVLFAALDLAGIACSVGSACASGAAEASAALAATGASAELVRGSVRFSFGRDMTAERIDEAVSRIARVVGRML